MERLDVLRSSGALDAVETDDKQAETEGGSGYLVTELALLPERAILDKAKLAAVLKCDPRTINNLVARGELPPPVTLCKRAVWMAGAILTHLEKRIDRELSRAQRYGNGV